MHFGRVLRQILNDFYRRNGCHYINKNHTKCKLYDEVRGLSKAIDRFEGVAHDLERDDSVCFDEICSDIKKWLDGLYSDDKIEYGKYSYIFDSVVKLEVIYDKLNDEIHGGDD